MNARTSYRGLMRLPAWLLLDIDRKVIASVRAATPEEARAIFAQHGLSGRWLRAAP